MTRAIDVTGVRSYRSCTNNRNSHCGKMMAMRSIADVSIPVAATIPHFSCARGHFLAECFDGQNLSELARWIDPWKSPNLNYIVSVLSGAYLVIGPGADGVIFDSTGNLIAESADFAGTDLAIYDIDRLSSQAIDLDEDMIVGIDPGWWNYYHWIVISLSRMMICDRALGGNLTFAVADYWTDPGHPFRPRYTRDVWHATLVAAGIRSRVRVLSEGVYRLRSAFFPWLDTWERHRQPAFISYFDEFSSAMKRIKMAVYPKQSGTRRLVLARENDDRLTDEAIMACHRLCEQDGFERVRLERLTFYEQSKIFSEAEAIVAPHGSGLTNLLIGWSGTKVFELNMHLYGDSAVRPWFYLLADRMGQRYRYIDLSRTPLPAKSICRAALAFFEGAPAIRL